MGDSRYQARPLCHKSGNGVKEHTGNSAGGRGATRDRQMERLVKSPRPYPFPDQILISIKLVHFSRRERDIEQARGHKGARMIWPWSEIQKWIWRLKQKLKKYEKEHGS